MKIEQIEAYCIHLTDRELRVIKKALNNYYEKEAYTELSSGDYEALENMIEDA